MTTATALALGLTILLGVQSDISSCGCLAFVAPSPTCSTGSRVSTRLHMDLKPLATEGDWTAYLDDETTGLVYFFNGKTGESVWEPPTDTFPAVKMTKTQERTMKQKRREYEESLEVKGAGAVAAAAAADGSTEEASKSGSGGGGFFASLMSGSAVAEESSTADATIDDEPIVEEVMKAPKKGFGAFFASSPAAAPSAAASAGGIIEEVIADDGAYAGSYKDKTSSAPAPSPATSTAPAPSGVVEEM